MRLSPLAFTGLLLLHGAPPCGAASESPRETPRGTWRAELGAGWMQSGRGFEGISLAARGSFQLSRRTHLRLGIGRFEASRGPDEALGAATSFKGLSQWALDVGPEIELNPGRRVVAALTGSAVVVHGRASDAEEWERIGTTSLGLRAAASARFRLRDSVYLRTELGARWYERRFANPRTFPPDPDRFPPLTEHVTDWEVSVTIGWVMRPGGHARRQATE